MSATYTTSAQKTLTMPEALILKKLEDAFTKNNSLLFKPTNNSSFKMAVLPDSSKLVIAAFKKANGKTLAMIDFKNVPSTKERTEVQTYLRNRLEEIFSTKK